MIVFVLLLLMVLMVCEEKEIVKLFKLIEFFLDEVILKD